MVHLVHDVLIRFKNGSEQSARLTDLEAFQNIKAGNTLFVAKCSGNFVFGNSKTPFTNLTSNVLSQLQKDSPALTIEIVSCSNFIMDVTDIHDFHLFEIDPPPPPTPPPNATPKQLCEAEGKTWIGNPVGSEFNGSCFSTDTTPPPPPPPPPATTNSKFVITFTDDTRFDFIATEADYLALDAEPKVPEYFISGSTDTSLNTTHTLAQIRAFIQSKLASLPNDEINTTMITQSIGAFEIIDNRIKGEVLYIANNSFNPFWNNKNILSVMQFKDTTGQVILRKENNMQFTQIERDERIMINESAFNSSPIQIDFFVFDTTLTRAFADPKQILVTKGLPPPPDPPPIVTKSDSIFLLLKGVLAGSIALTLLDSKK